MMWRVFITIVFFGLISIGTRAEIAATLIDLQPVSWGAEGVVELPAVRLEAGRNIYLQTPEGVVISNLYGIGTWSNGILDAFGEVNWIDLSIESLANNRTLLQVHSFTDAWGHNPIEDNFSYVGYFLVMISHGSSPNFTYDSYAGVYFYEGADGLSEEMKALIHPMGDSYIYQGPGPAVDPKTSGIWVGNGGDSGAPISVLQTDQSEKSQVGSGMEDASGGCSLKVSNSAQSPVVLSFILTLMGLMFWIRLSDLLQQRKNL